MKDRIKSYGKIYRKALSESGIEDIDKKVSSYERRLEEMYASEDFKGFNVYPSTNVTHVYAVIAMCLELKELGFEEPRIIEIINTGFSARRNFYKRLIRAIDLLPNAYRIAHKWNISDHEKRVEDGSLTYDYFNVAEDKIEYCISRCIYVQMFEHYGIRPLSKIFCMTDTTAYENLPKHVVFIRHSDLSDGLCCHDEVMDKRKR